MQYDTACNFLNPKFASTDDHFAYHRYNDDGCLSFYSSPHKPLPLHILQLKDSPYHYSSHVELIQLLRQLGDLDQARQARQRMSEAFPLSEGRSHD